MRAGELKAGPKTQKLQVQVAQCPKTLNRIVAQSSHIWHLAKSRSVRYLHTRHLSRAMCKV
jgi:hypothetical protein